jgi:DNA-binding response OmpR family regulator
MTQPFSILIIEDEPLISMMMEDFVDMLGYGVAGSVDSVVDALGQIEAGGFDAAILDVHLRDGVCWPVADALAERNIPFLIATGGHVEPPPAAHADAPQLAKPFTLDGVTTALEELQRTRA